MKTKILKAEIDSSGCLQFPAQKEAAECLASGGVVAFPTETVYGLGVNAEMPAAMDRLRELKKRSEDKPFTLHVSASEDLGKYVEEIPGKAKRLIQRFWPGPLTIVFPTADGKGQGVRLPADKVAIGIIESAGVPVVAPSANASGDDPACSAERVAELFSGRIEMIVDGGPTRIKQSSTVVGFRNGSAIVLREGIITSEMVRRATSTTILFVCGGNSCRSPMAEAICREMLARKHDISEDVLPEYGYEILSAGTSALDGGSVSLQAVEALRSLGYGPPCGSSTHVTPEGINAADHIFTMTGDQRTKVLQLVPGTQSVVDVLDPEGIGINDPIGGAISVYEECARRIRSCLETRLEKL